jgi:hypothetical protein
MGCAEPRIAISQLYSTAKGTPASLDERVDVVELDVALVVVVVVVVSRLELVALRDVAELATELEDRAELDDPVLPPVEPVELTPVEAVLPPLLELPCADVAVDAPVDAVLPVVDPALDDAVDPTLEELVPTVDDWLVAALEPVDAALLDAVVAVDAPLVEAVLAVLVRDAADAFEDAAVDDRLAGPSRCPPSVRASVDAPPPQATTSSGARSDATKSPVFMLRSLLGSRLDVASRAAAVRAEAAESSGSM